MVYKYFYLTKVVCGADCRITNIVARWRGSTHDSRIFNESQIKARFNNNEFRGILLGDNGYACLPFLLTPLLNPQTMAEEAYNASHKSTRNTVERCFGQWKMIFKALHRGLTTSLETSKIMIVAMAVLHNIRLQMINGELRLENDDEDGDMNGMESDSSDSEDDFELEDEVAEPMPQQNMRGNIVRRNFIDRYFA